MQPDFEAGVEYWSKVPASVNGVLGGYGDGPVPLLDSISSCNFLLKLKPSLSRIVPPHRQSVSVQARVTKALDAGAGIGRVTQTTLLPLFDRVDLVEPVHHFLQRAVDNSGSWRGIEDNTKGVRFYQAGLQHFNPNSPPEAFAGPVGASDRWDAGYDVCWIQWVTPHLSDAELVHFLRQCRQALCDSGPDPSYVVIKENIASDQDIFDKDDSSITRCEATLIGCFERAGLTIVCEEEQQGMPIELFQVKMYALR